MGARLFSSPAAWGRAGVVSALVGAALVGACVIADPAPEVPIPPPHRPTILHGSVQPPTNVVLTSFPTKFDVPVELVDPSQSAQYSVFIDFPTQPSPVFQGTVDPDPSLTDAGVRVISVYLNPPEETFGCHVIEFIVAHQFTGASPHTPDAVGGDSVVWFYNPGGSPGGCPEYDAGLDGAFPDGDAGAGGDP